MPESERFRKAVLVAELARAEYEVAFAKFTEQGDADSLRETSRRYREWRDLEEMTTLTAYFDRYGLLPHKPGAP